MNGFLDLASARDIHPVFATLNELYMRNILRSADPLFQEMEAYVHYYGGLSEDPVRSMPNMYDKFPAMMMMQELMHEASSGAAAYNVYMGKHGVGCGLKPLKDSTPVVPNHNDVHHIGLSRGSWSDKAVIAGVESGVYVQFLLIMNKFIHEITNVKSQSLQHKSSYCSIIFDGKGISPGVELFNGKLYGVLPSITGLVADEWVGSGVAKLLEQLIQKFKLHELDWVKESEVFMVQLLDIMIAIPVAIYHLPQKTGNADVIAARMATVARYTNSCDNCLRKSLETGDAPTCETKCKDCTSQRKVCKKHTRLYATWDVDDRPCLPCAEGSLHCSRMVVVISVSDAAGAYAKFGKRTRISHESRISDASLSAGKLPFHVHDVNHHIKNAVASLTRGTHFDGEHIYDCNDLAIVLSTVDDADYQELIKGVSHQAIMQYDKHSDEQTRQLVSRNVVDAYKKVGVIVRTEVPENRRPWFADDHDKIEKPMFITVSRSGVVFVSDEGKQCLWCYTHLSLPRKLHFYGSGTTNATVVKHHSFQDMDSLTFKCISGVCLIGQESVLAVADTGLQCLRVVKGVRKLKNESVDTPLDQLNFFPGMKLQFCTVEIADNNIFPCGISEVPSSGLVLVTDIFNHKVLVLQLACDYLTAVIQMNIDLEGMLPFDCAFISGSQFAVVDITAEDGGLHIIDAECKEIVASVQQSSIRGVCADGETIYISDPAVHCVYRYNLDEQDLVTIAGQASSPGFQDGPVHKAKLTAPTGLCLRGSTVYIAESPANHQGSVRVVSDLTGLTTFTSALHDVAEAFGVVSRRELRDVEEKKKKEILDKTLLNGRPLLASAAIKLDAIIDAARTREGVKSLDIKHGSMPSETADAISKVLVAGLEYLTDYFEYRGKEELIPRVKMKCISTQMIECFLGYLVQHTPGNNLTFLGMCRGFSKHALTYAIPYLASEGCGLSLRNDKYRNVKDSYETEEIDVGEHGALRWKLVKLRQEMLLSVGKRRRLLSKNESSECGIGTDEGCKDILDTVETASEHHQSLTIVKEALKTRPMKALRGFYKRKFGTSPTILGVQLPRPERQAVGGTVSYLQNTNFEGYSGETTNVQALAFNAGDFLVFRGTDGLPFNILRAQCDQTIEGLRPQLKVVGDFLECIGVAEGFVNFRVNVEWLGSNGAGMLFSHILCDAENRFIDVEFYRNGLKDGQVVFNMEQSVYDELVLVSEKFELSIQECAHSKTNEAEDNDDDDDDDDDDLDNETEHEIQPLLRGNRKNRGNRYATVFSDLLKK